MIQLLLKDEEGEKKGIDKLVCALLWGLLSWVCKRARAIDGALELGRADHGLRSKPDRRALVQREGYEGWDREFR